MIVNTQKIAPMPVITGAAAYPDNVLEALRARGRTFALDALALAYKAGEPRAVNLVLLGALASLTQDDVALWEKAIAACVPEELLRVNLDAFELGREEVPSV